jgi:hypothetical protein
MNINNVAMVIVFIAGVWWLLLGLKTKKSKEGRQAGILLILGSVCAFLLTILAVLFAELTLTSRQRVQLHTIRSIIAGMWLGVFVAMILLSHFKLLIRFRKTSG